MLGWTLMFLIIALIAGVLGFTGIVGAAVGIAKILFLVSGVIGFPPWCQMMRRQTRVSYDQ